MDLLRGVMVDQHFTRRGRTGRLLAALARFPHLLGVGIDEDTAAILEGDGTMRVLGSGAVTVIDASGMRFTDSHMADRDQPLAMLGLKLDFLTTGCRYDLNRRCGIPPAPGEVKRSGDFETSDVDDLAVGSLP